MKLNKLSRRKFILAALALTSCAVAADAKWLEPDWVKIRKVRIGDGKPSHRLVYFTDLHYKGDRVFAESVINQINSMSPDFVCFGGDIMEDVKFLPAALEILSGIKSPLFGVPGNHDFWSRAPFAMIHNCFAATGGAWLLDQHRITADGKINVIGASCLGANGALPRANPEMKNILLMHYPAWVKKLGGQTFDLMLAGHSHGGQVRIPFYGAITLPFGVDEYDLGLFQTGSGPLYVNPGIGYLGDYDIRFNCRPEITVIEI